MNVVRDHRLALTRRVSERTGRRPQPATILDAHRLLITFLRWADGEEYPVDQRILRLKAPKVPDKRQLAQASHLRLSDALGRWDGLIHGGACAVHIARHLRPCGEARQRVCEHARPTRPPGARCSLDRMLPTA